MLSAPLMQAGAASVDSLYADSIARNLAQMEEFYRQGRWDDAMHLGRGILKDAPKDSKEASRAQDLIVLSIDGKNQEMLANAARERKRQQEDSAAAYITEGNALLAQNNYSSAADKFSKALKNNGGDAQTWFLSGYASLKAGRRKEAYNALKKCLSLDPKHERALFHIAGLSYEFNHSTEAEEYSKKLIEVIEKKLEEYKQIFSGQKTKGLNDKAMATTRKITALQNNLSQACSMHGILAQNRKAYKEALPSLDKAAKLNPENSENWFRLGNCYLSLKVYHQASVALEQAVLLRENKLKECSDSANQLLKAGKSDEAVSAELETRKLKQDTAQALYALALTNAKVNDNRTALKNIDEALRLKPDFIQARYNRALILAQNNELDDALDEMRKVLKDCPPNSQQAKNAIKTIKIMMDQIARRDSPVEYATAQKPSKMIEVDKYVKDMHGLGGKSAENQLEDVFPRLREIAKLVKLRNYDEAIRRLIYLRSSHPEVADIHSVLAQCYMELNRLNEAEKSFDQALAIQPNHEEALNGLAYIYATREEKLDVALKYANKAVSLNETKAEFHHTLGWVLFKSGEVQKSIPSFKRALDLNSDYLIARYNLGLAYYLTKDYRQALEAFNYVLEINPTHDKALMFKAIALAKTNNAEEALATLDKLKKNTIANSALNKVVSNLHTKIRLAYDRHTDLPVPEIKSPAPIEKLMAEGNEFRKNGLVNRAKEKYLECQRLAPDRYEPYEALGEMYAESGLNIPALSAFEKAYKLNPDNYEITMNIGRMHQKLNRPEHAKSFFARAEALRYDEAEPKYYLGLIAYETKDFEGAESYALDAIRVNPNYHKAMALCGMARMRLNRLKPARDIYESLYAKAPANSSIKRHARQKIWEITKMMAPAQYPSVEDAMDVKEQLVRKVTDSDTSKIVPDTRNASAIEEYGKNTMTPEDKMWVLRQLDKFGSVKTPTLTAPLKGNVSNQTLTSQEKKWVVDKLQNFNEHSSKYALPDDLKAGNKYAIKATEKKSDRQPDQADAVISSGLAKAEKGLIAQALEDFRKAASISPTNTEALVNLGFMNTMQGNFKDAFDAYAKLTVSHPEEPLGHLGLGNLYWLGGQAEKAVDQWSLIKGEFEINSTYNILALNERVWSRMLEVDPVDTEAHSNLGLVYMFNGQYKKALAEFQAVNQLEQGHPEHQFYQAQIYALLYTQNKTKSHKKEAQNILEILAQGPQPFPHSERLKKYLAKL